MQVADAIRRVARAGVRLMLLLLRPVLGWLAMKVAPRYTVLGVEVVDLSPGAIGGAAIPKVQAVLELISTVDGRCAAQLRTEIQRIILMRSSRSRGEYWHHSNACALDLDYLLRREPERVALTVVHELNHARLANCGVVYRGEMRRTIERSCVAAELRFARKLDTPDRWIVEARAKLSDEWWRTDDGAASRLARDADYKMPSWVRRITRFLWE